MPARSGPGRDPRLDWVEAEHRHEEQVPARDARAGRGGGVGDEARGRPHAARHVADASPAPGGHARGILLGVAGAGSPRGRPRAPGRGAQHNRAPVRCAAGLTLASWRSDEPPQAGTEERMAEFAQLLDTAVANADSRDQLTASRARGRSLRASTLADGWCGICMTARSSGSCTRSSR
jgi:hypothetical protein